MRYDIKAKVRTYKDKSGEEKNVYANIGSAWIGDKTSSITLEMIPLNWDGKAFLNEPYERDEPKQEEVVLKDIAPTPIDLTSIPF
jgi:hypothetical protein